MTRPAPTAIGRTVLANLPTAELYERAIREGEVDAASRHPGCHANAGSGVHDGEAAVARTAGSAVRLTAVAAVARRHQVVGPRRQARDADFK